MLQQYEMLNNFDAKVNLKVKNFEPDLTLNRNSRVFILL